MATGAEGGGGAVEVEGTGEAVDMEESSSDSGCFERSEALTFDAFLNTLSWCFLVLMCAS